MNVPEVSILMPVYNEEKHISSCLKSILSQDFENWELVVVDDFSTDESFSILGQFASRDDRIRLYRNVEKGIIPALKLAFEQCSGRFITRMDADDLMPTLKLSAMRDVLLDKGMGNIVSGKVAYFSDGVLAEGFKSYENWLNIIASGQSYWSHIYKECVVPSACWMAYKSDLVEIRAFRDSRYPEDYDLVFRFYQAGFQVIGIDKVLHRWRDHPERASRNDPNYADQNFFALKVHYFKEVDFDEERTLVLWGAGKKGKKLARELAEAELPFRWVTENEKKVGKDIYGVIVENFLMLSDLEEKQVLVAISSKEFQENRQQVIDSINTDVNAYFYFC